MKKAFIFALAFMLLVSCAITASALDTTTTDSTAQSDQAILESIFDYFDSHTTITDIGNGVQVATLDVVASSITLDELLKEVNVTTVSKPIVNAVKSPDYSYTTNQTHTPLDIEDKFLYSHMSDELKGYYKQIDKAVKNLDAESSKFRYDESYVHELYFSYMFDNPEHFYLGNTVQITSYGDTFKYDFCYAASSDHYGTGYNIDDDLRAAIIEKRTTFENRVNSFISTIPANAPNVIKEKLAYSKILRESYYNLSAGLNPSQWWNGINEDNWNAYGILCNGYGVCESYAEAFQVICHRLGIECTGIVGTAGGGHKWNAVKIEGEWYQCDITFDDPVGGGADDALNYYFNLTDAQMTELHHDWSYCDYTVPVCTATKYMRDNFFAVYDEDENGTIHNFTSTCDSSCENCSFTRFNGGHEYEDNSTVCNRCGEDKSKKNGWNQEGDNWYYLENGNKVTSDWRKDSTGWCYLDYDGKWVKNTFVQDSTEKWAYIGPDGYFYEINGWIEQYETWYYLEKGYRVQGEWKKDNTGWCYLDEWNGYCVKNTFIQDSTGKWAYIGPDGYFKETTGWVEGDYGHWYYVENGYRVQGDWRKDGNGWCYLDEDYGNWVKEKFVKDSTGKWAYIGADGYFHENTFWVEHFGDWFYVENGYRVENGWRKDSTGWCYLNSNGYWVKDYFIQDSTGKYAYIGPDGYFYETTGWIKYNIFWYYLEKGYRVEKEWRQDSNGWCYLNASGYMATNTWVEDSNGWCFLDASGYWDGVYHKFPFAY